MENVNSTQSGTEVPINREMPKPIRVQENISIMSISMGGNLFLEKLTFLVGGILVIPNFGGFRGRDSLEYLPSRLSVHSLQVHAGGCLPLT